MTRIEEYQKYMKKLKVIADRPSNPSLLDYVFSFEATKTIKVEIEHSGRIFSGILKTFET